jgi:hypothetical protein
MKEGGTPPEEKSATPAPAVGGTPTATEKNTIDVEVKHKS